MRTIVVPVEVLEHVVLSSCLAMSGRALLMRPAVRHFDDGCRTFARRRGIIRDLGGARLYQKDTRVITGRRQWIMQRGMRNKCKGLASAGECQEHRGSGLSNSLPHVLIIILVIWTVPGD